MGTTTPRELPTEIHAVLRQRLVLRMAVHANSRGQVVVVLDDLGVLLVADLAQEDLVYLLLVGSDSLIALGLRLRKPGVKTAVSDAQLS